MEEQPSQEDRLDQSQQEKPRPINPCWSTLTEGYLHSGIRKFVVTLGTLSATYPWTTVVLTCFISLALLVIGFFTNFQLELNQLHFVTPTNSLPHLHSKWIYNKNDENINNNSGFPNVRVFYLNIHNHGKNILHGKAMEVALEAMEVLQSTLHYDDLCLKCSDCSESDRDMLFDGTSYCRISSVTQFWDHSQDKFQQQISLMSDDDKKMDEYGAYFRICFEKCVLCFIKDIHSQYHLCVLQFTFSLYSPSNCFASNVSRWYSSIP